MNKKIEAYIQILGHEFEKNGNANIALEQKAYMRNQFAYFGLKTPIRREIQKAFLEKEHLPSKIEMQQMVKILWLKPQREFQYFAQELAYKYLKQLEVEDIQLFEFMIIHKSWWDTVDFIAVKLLGAYFKKFPKRKEEYVNKCLVSTNLWLQRSAVLFQLKYKKEVDTKLLERTINTLLGSKEFFINKAIGWMLREYSRTNSVWVINFVQKTELHSLSRREALRLLK